MADWRVRLADSRVMLVNDDGIDAPGLALMERLVTPLAREVWVVAPEREESGTSHAFSLHRPLRLRQAGPRRFAVDGMPTDAVILGLKVAMADAPPDIVLSGVNRGANIGDDSCYSGTVGAAMEAAMAGVPAVALSLNKTPPAEANWETVERHFADTLNWALAEAWPRGVVLNVNFPECDPSEVAGRKLTRLGRRRPGAEIMVRTDPAGRPYHWISSKRISGPLDPESDVAAEAANFISLTPLSYDLTDEPTLEAARKRMPS